MEIPANYRRELVDRAWGSRKWGSDPNFPSWARWTSVPVILRVVQFPWPPYFCSSGDAMLSWILLSSLLISQAFERGDHHGHKRTDGHDRYSRVGRGLQGCRRPSPGRNDLGVYRKQCSSSAESGNQLLSWSEGREPWIDASRALIAASEATVEAAREMELDRFLDLGDMILVSCSNCHDVYLE